MLGHPALLRTLSTVEPAATEVEHRPDGISVAGDVAIGRAVPTGLESSSVGMRLPDPTPTSAGPNRHTILPH